MDLLFAITQKTPAIIGKISLHTLNDNSENPVIKAIKNKTLSIKDLDRATKNVLKLVYSFDKNKELSDKDKKAIFENL